MRENGISVESSDISPLCLSAGAQIHSLTHGKNIESLGLGLKTKSKDLEVATPQISQKI